MVKYKECDFLKEARKTEYTKQAEDFLTKHGLTLTISYMKTGEYLNFMDNKLRNIFRWTLSKGGKRVWGSFGDSEYSTEHNQRPTAYDILACLTHDDPGSFEEFCASFGYDTDSRSAERTYRGVTAEWKKIQRVCDEAALNELREIN